MKILVAAALLLTTAALADEPPKMSPEEQKMMDDVESAAAELAEALKKEVEPTTGEPEPGAPGIKVIDILKKSNDNKERRRWMKIFEPFAKFYDKVEAVTGY